MRVDEQGRIQYGWAWIKEHPDWLKKHSVGPVHWDVWNYSKTILLVEDIGAFDLSPFLESKGLLVRW